MYPEVIYKVKLKNSQIYSSIKQTQTAFARQIIKKEKHGVDEQNQYKKYLKKNKKKSWC